MNDTSVHMVVANNTHDGSSALMGPGLSQRLAEWQDGLTGSSYRVTMRL